MSLIVFPLGNEVPLVASILGDDSFNGPKDRNRASMSSNLDSIALLNSIQEFAEMRFGFKSPEACFDFDHVQLV